MSKFLIWYYSESHQKNRFLKTIMKDGSLVFTYDYKQAMYLTDELLARRIVITALFREYRVSLREITSDAGLDKFRVSEGTS